MTSKSFGKKTITNVQLKPNSCHDPKILNGVFKGFVHRAHKICSEHHLKDEIEFLINVFKENGYNELSLRKLSDEVWKKIHVPQDTNSSEQAPDTLQTVTLPWIPGYLDTWSIAPTEKSISQSRI